MKSHPWNFTKTTKNPYGEARDYVEWFYGYFGIFHDTGRECQKILVPKKDTSRKQTSLTFAKIET